MAKFNRIIMHHTGGSYTAGNADKEAYHTITEGDGTTVRGNHDYDDNANGRRLTPGSYAAHTRGLNTGSIGKAVACMGGGQWRYPFECDYFPRGSQMTAFLVDVAKDCKIYGIPVSRETVLSHAEVEITLGVDQRSKWDFDYDPFKKMDTRDPIVIGDVLREQVSRFMVHHEVIQVLPAPVEKTVPPLLRQGDRGEEVRMLQAALVSQGYKIAVDGIFGPTTRRTVIAHQRSRQLVPDGIVGKMTWTSLL